MRKALREVGSKYKSGEWDVKNSRQVLKGANNSKKKRADTLTIFSLVTAIVNGDINSENEEFTDQDRWIHLENKR